MIEELTPAVKEIQQMAGIYVNETPLLSEIDLEEIIKREVKESFLSEFRSNDETFEISWIKYKNMKCFPALGNIYEIGGEIDKETHFVMRAVATWHIERALRALKFDTTNDPNLKSDDESSNIGSAGRIAKIWGGKNLDPENIREFGDGRWTKQPRLAAFPANDNDKGKPVTVVIDNPGIGSVCSHHFLPYGITRDNNSKIVISYVPDKNLLGLSKIGRFVEWCLNRPSLQEEVTHLIHKKIKDIAGTQNVYVGLYHLVHQCEVSRGAKQYSTTTTESYSGDFNNLDFRNAILKNI